MDTFGFVDIVFIHMLAENHRGDSQSIRETGQDNIPIPITGNDEISATDHQRSPDNQDRDLSQSDIF